MTEDPCPEAIDIAFETLTSLRRLKHTFRKTEGLQKACEAASKMLDASWLAAFSKAADLRPGAPEPDEESGVWVSMGLECRSILEEISSELLAPELFQQLDAVDEAYKSFGPALLVIDRETYDGISRGLLPPGWASWRNENRQDQIDADLRAWGAQQAR